MPRKTNAQKDGASHAMGDKNSFYRTLRLLYVEDNNCCPETSKQGIANATFPLTFALIKEPNLRTFLRTFGSRVYALTVTIVSFEIDKHNLRINVATPPFF